MGSLVLCLETVSAIQLDNNISLKKSQSNLQPFPSIPKSSSEEFRRDRRRLEEDRRVNDQNKNTIQKSSNNRNRLDSLDIPILPSKKTTAFNSNNNDNINPFQVLENSFGDRLNQNNNDNSGKNVGSRRPPSSYTNLSPSNNRLPSLRTSRRLEQDRNVNSKNQIILEKTTNLMGSGRRPVTNPRNEINPSRSQVGISVSSQLDGRGADETRNRNQINLQQNNQNAINSIRDDTVKRPPINYRTLLDNDLRSSNQNEIFRQGRLILLI